MKFVKANLFPIICGLLVMISVVLLFYPIGAKSSQLRNDMINGMPPDNLGLGSIATIQNLENPQVPLFAGGPPIDSPVTDNIIAQKQKIQQQMQNQAQNVENRFLQDNAFGRVTYDSAGNIAPLLGTVAMPNLLPNPSANNSAFTLLGNFRSQYLELFSTDPSDTNSWLGQLHAAAPPSQTQIAADVDQQIASLNAATPGGLGNNQDQQRAQLYQQTVRESVFNTAKSCLVYAAPSSFQERAFVSSPSLPLAGDIYEAFVDSWLQNDVVTAIVNTNAGSQDVGDSPVKRLIHIAIGADASFGSDTESPSSPSTPGGPNTLVNDQNLFVMSSSSSSQSAPQVGLQFRPGSFGGPSSGSTTNMTGHVSNSQYQVTYLAFSVIIVPWKLNNLIDNLYRRNNGYTVIQVSTQTVDPVEALSDGYVYG
ncbi:MAG TPA: hypothetical protein VKJ65_13485, partial [Phycisphaerae bacterium]|nr:hypothetical protein [Phycisphaerae bacterium]